MTAHVANARPEVPRALGEEEPLRLDVVTPDGTPLGSITSESERNDEGAVQDLERAWKEPDRDLHNRHEDRSRGRDGTSGDGPVASPR